MVLSLGIKGDTEHRMVTCECGVEDDHGELMVACDICEIWQHTCCHGIEDSLPPLFLCSSCWDVMGRALKKQRLL